MTRTYDDWKTTDPRDMEPPEKPERDPDDAYDEWRDEQLQDIEAKLDERADVDDGIPNDAMRLLVGVRDVIRKLEGR